jgi:adenylate cyclase, class 2
MKTEYEAKILNINVNQITKKLQELGAKRKSQKIQKRYVYDLKPKQNNSWLRLRTNGEETTLTIKEIKNNNIDGTKENEIIVDDFEKTNLLLRNLGYSPKGYQENKRISYLLDNVKIEIDFWPRIPPYLEIESDSIKKVKDTIKKLGYNISDSTSINTDEVYKKYGIDLYKIKNLKFKE